MDKDILKMGELPDGLIKMIVLGVVFLVFIYVVSFKLLNSLSHRDFTNTCLKEAFSKYKIRFMDCNMEISISFVILLRPQVKEFVPCQIIGIVVLNNL